MASLPFRVKSIYDYASAHDDDLSFPTGQIITITDEEDDDWYYGEYTDSSGETKQGLFPKNFVERYEPTTPPRPSRPVKAKREPEPEPSPAQAPAEVKEYPEQSESRTAAVEEERFEERGLASLAQANDGPIDGAGGVVAPAVTEPLAPSLPADKPAEQSKIAPDVPVQTTQAAIGASTSKTKSPPPAIAEKPTSSSFRDRIAAFNKPAAPPVQPLKPSQASGSSFVKKQYVAPPPSRNAYVPPPREPPPSKIYKRDEDASLPQPVKEDTWVPPPAREGQGEDSPKPTSLKERIALLQKQQLEQAARHAEAAQRKEKPKKPPKRKSDLAHEDLATGEEAPAEVVMTGAAFPETEEEEAPVAPKPSRRRSKSKDRTPIASPDSAPREFLSDGNDADQSAGGETEDGETSYSGRSNVKPPTLSQRPLPPIRQQTDSPDIAETKESNQPEARVEDNDEDNDEDEAEEEEAEEEEIDPEVKRRMEIRDRIAKMSGGMGMAGMFGAPGGLPPAGAKKPKVGSGGSKIASVGEEEPRTIPSQAVPVMALPGMSMPSMTKVRTPEPIENPMKVAPIATTSAGQSSGEESAYDEEDLAEQRSMDKLRSPPPPPQDTAIPAVPPTPRGVPPIPSTSFGRAPPPPPPADTRPPPPAPARALSAGSDLDDELSAHPDQDATPDETSDTRHFSGRKPPPPPAVATSRVADSASGLRSPSSITSSPIAIKSPTSPQSPSTVEKRISRAPPPIPGAAPPAISPPPQSRAPPPPPPPTRESNEAPRGLISTNQLQDESEEVTEYEGDYDTDIALGETHKDALKAHDQSSSADDTLTGDEDSYHHSGLPSLGPPPLPPLPTGTGAPRGAPPPPPPSQPPRQSRQSSEVSRPPPPPPTQAPGKSRKSSDMPRGVPPPPPVPQQPVHLEEDYDPYNYNARPPPIPGTPSYSKELPIAANVTEDFDDRYAASPAETARAVPPELPSATAPLLPTAMQTPKVRQSLDVPQGGMSRRSVDAARPSMEQAHAFIADEIDVGQDSLWWTQRKMPPPSLQNRNDVTYEIEESTAIQPSGEELIMKHVYVLFIDYSQTILTARYSPRDPSKVDFSQRLEPPPSALRQDQLENAHSKYGVRIADMMNGKANSIVGNGAPLTLIAEMLHGVSDALPAIGTRAYGSCIYSNLANASVQQYDEIRPGDIISFRNAKMQGHKGPMKQKYNVDIGKPDHVAIVLDWDGTKKKVRAWEQGRESKKVKLESFKLADLRSGEVKVWRVIGRDWVGWGGKA